MNLRDFKRETLDFTNRQHLRTLKYISLNWAQLECRMIISTRNYRNSWIDQFLGSFLISWRSDKRRYHGDGKIKQEWFLSISRRVGSRSTISILSPPSKESMKILEQPKISQFPNAFVEYKSHSRCSRIIPWVPRERDRERERRGRRRRKKRKEKEATSTFLRRVSRGRIKRGLEEKRERERIPRGISIFATRKRN